MTTNRRFLTLLCATAIFDSAGAQESPERETEAPRRYNVEVIVFTYEEDVSVGNEVFVPEIPPALGDVAGAPGGAELNGNDEPLEGAGERDARDNADDARASDLEASDTGETEPEFVITPARELGLLDARSTLERLDVYRPVFHAAWTQAALPKTDSFVIELDMLDQPPPDLSGSFTLYLSRFLHLVVDLTLDEETVSDMPVAVDLPDLGYAESDDTLFPRPGVRYRIDEDRIFKNGDTRYFDHPKFGVIARVTRIEEPEEDESGPDAGTLLEQGEAAD